MTRVFSNPNFNGVLSSEPFGTNSAALEMDAACGQFSEHALDSVNLLAMTAGGLTYRLARVASLSALSPLPSLLRSPLASALSLSLEVFAFRGVNHAFHSTEESVWNAQGFVRDYTNFACLKGFGHYFQSSNAFLRHGFQNLGMMAGEEATTLLQLTPQSHSSFSERFVQASVTNLALGAGTFLSAWVTGHRLATLEKTWMQTSHSLLNSTQEHRSPVLSQMSKELSEIEYREILASQYPYTRSAELPHGERSEGHQVREAFRRRRQALNPQSENFAADFGDYTRLWEVTARRWGADQFFAYVGREESKALRETLRTPEFDLEDGIVPWVFRPEVARWFEVLPNASGEAREWFHYLARAYEVKSPLEPYIILAEKIDERGGVGDIERLVPQIRDRMVAYEVDGMRPDTVVRFNELCRLFRVLSDKLPDHHAENNQALDVLLRTVNRCPEKLGLFLPLLCRLIQKRQGAFEENQAGEILGVLTNLNFGRAQTRALEIRFVNAVLDRRLEITDWLYARLAHEYLSYEPAVSSECDVAGAQMIVRIAALSQEARQSAILERLRVIRTDALAFLNRTSYLGRLSLDPVHILEMKRRSSNFADPFAPGVIEYFEAELKKGKDEDVDLHGYLRPFDAEAADIHGFCENIARAVRRLRFFSILMKVVEEDFLSKGTDPYSFHEMNWRQYLEALETGDLQTLRSSTEMKHIWETRVSASLRSFREEAARVAEQIGTSRGALIREAMAAFDFVRNPETREEFEFETVEQVEKVLDYVREKDSSPEAVRARASRSDYIRARYRAEALDPRRFSFGRENIRPEDVGASPAVTAGGPQHQLREYTPELEAQREGFPHWMGAMTPATNPADVAVVAAGPQHQIPSVADVMAERAVSPLDLDEFGSPRTYSRPPSPSFHATILNGLHVPLGTMRGDPYAPPASIDINEIRMGEPHGTATAMQERVEEVVPRMFTDEEYQRAFELSVVTRDLRARVVANENPRDASLLAIHTVLRDIFSGPQGFAAFPQAAELTDMLIAGRLNNQEIARMVDAIETMANGHPLSHVLAQLLRNHSQFPDRVEPNRAPSSRRIHHMERPSLERNLERGNELEPYTAAEEAIRQEIQELGEMLFENIQLRFENGWERDWEIRQVTHLMGDAIRRLAQGEYRARRIDAPPTVLQGDVQDVDSNIILERLRYLARGNFPQDAESPSPEVSNAIERPLTPEEQEYLDRSDNYGDRGY